MPGDTTMTHTGQRSVPVRTTGHDKGLFTVVLAALADGKKLKPFVVIKGVRPVAELHKVLGVIIAYSKIGWMNEKLTIGWLSVAGEHSLSTLKIVSTLQLEMSVLQSRFFVCSG